MSTPAPTVTASLLDRLRDEVGREAVVHGRDAVLVYESDALTAYRSSPGAVVLPRDTGELSRVVRLLHQAGVPFVPRGAGTGLSGGALAQPGSVIVATPRMNRILDVDGPNRRARVQPGVVNAELTRATTPLGLHYAPDPSSQSACTLGGNVAENSGGPHCLKYGVTSRYVLGLTVVLPDGQVVELGRADREPEGLDLMGLFVGSEGCFGIASEIEVGLVPIAPGVRTLLAIFESVEAAGSAVTDIMARGLLPAALEIIDRETIRAVEASVFRAGYPTDAGAALVVEFDGMEAGLDADAREAGESCRRAGAREVRTAKSEAERTALWRGRKKAFGAMGRIAPDLMVQDATVPRSRLVDVLARISEIGRAHSLTVANVFHAGDGNLHPNILFDRRDPDELARVEAASSEMMDVCVAAGGTITGEHGVGVDKRRYMAKVHAPEALEAMAAVRDVFDPSGLCNPGKVLPDEVRPFRFPGIPRGTPDGPRPGAEIDASELAAAGFPVVPRSSWPQGLRESEVGAAVAPSDTAQTAALLAWATERGWRVGAAGTGSHGALPPVDLLVLTGRLTAVEEHQAEDLTVTAGAGLTSADLGAAVATAGQWLPIDSPGTVTLGGLLAVANGGSLEAGYGAVRDQVLGLTLVSGDGRVLELGGRVMKNVAGFDLLRAVVGSRGRLGVITRATFRLHPVPARDGLLVARMLDRSEAVEWADAVRRAPVPLVALEVIGPPGGSGGWSVMARAHGRAEAVSEILERLRETREAPPTEILDGAARDAFLSESLGWEARAALVVHARGLPGTLDRLLARMGALARTFDRAGGEGGDAAVPGPDTGIAAHAMGGLVRIGISRRLLPTGPESRSELLSALADVRRATEAEGGSLRLIRCPPDLRLPPRPHEDDRAGSLVLQDLRGGVARVFDPAGVMACAP